MSRSIKPHQLKQVEDQKRRLWLAGCQAKVDLLFPVYSGTFYSERFKKIRELKSLSELTGLKYDY